jgi:hypothetical protein
MGRTVKDKDTGERVFSDDVIGYYSTIPRAMQRYVSTYLNNTLDVVTIREYIDEYQRVTERVVELLPRL